MGRLVREVNKARGARFTTRSNESPLIALNLFVEGRATPLRVLVDSGASENFIRSRSLSDSLNYKEKRCSPSRLLVRLATGATVELDKRTVQLSYTCEGRESDDEFIVLDLVKKFDVILEMSGMA